MDNFKHTIKVLTTKEVESNRSSAYDYLNLDEQPQLYDKSNLN